MDRQKALSGRDRFMKLSLRKNRSKLDEKVKKPNRSSDCIILDESFDRIRSDFPSKIQPSPKIYSPIVINDSDSSVDKSLVIIDQEPSKTGNVSFNCTKEDKSPIQENRPSIGGWSPAQTILCGTPKNTSIPSTPKDIANISQKDCSIKIIQQSQKKLLNDLYGESWKTLPALFKTIKHKYDSIEGISKKLYFNDDDDKENNIRRDLKANKELYLTNLTNSETKLKVKNDTISDRKSKKKLYTEKIPSTPDITKQKPVRTRNVNTTTKKKKAMSVTELVESMKDVALNNKGDNGTKPDSFRTPVREFNRLSFVGSLADATPSWRCHPEAIQYHDSYKNLREQLTRRLYVEFNKQVFGDQLDADMIIVWDSKLRSTAGTTTNRLIKTASGDRLRSSNIKLSSKVVDGPQRLRDTLIHELCHAATWLLDGTLRAGHGPLWKKWATRALTVYPELGEIARCHDLEIHYKYSYRCTKCGYSIKRHSKSIDITKKCCGYCRGTFEINVNKKKKDGAIVSTPARKGGMNDFASYVKENYKTMKDGSKTHAQVMKILGEQFSAQKKKLDT